MSRFLVTAAYPAALIVFLVIVALHWVHPGYVIAAVDLNMPAFLWHQFAQCAVPWNYTQSYLGQPSWCFTWSPVLLLHIVLAAIFGDSVGQAMRLVLPSILAVVGAFACARIMGLSNVASFVAALVYVLNPYTQIMIGVNLVVPIFAALLSWICALILLAARMPKCRRACTVALFAIFAAGVSTTVIVPHSIVDFALALAIWTGVTYLYCADRRPYSIWLLRTFGWVCIASLWWLLPAIVTVVSAENAHAVTVSGNAWTFARASLLNVMRFNPVWMWNYEMYFPSAADYDYNPVRYTDGFLFIVVILIAMIRLRGLALRVGSILALAGLMILLICKGPHEPLGGLTAMVMSLPILFVFQDPAGISIVALFFLSLLTGLLADDFSRLSKLAPALVALAFTFVAMTSAESLVNGEIFHGATYVAPSVYARLPGYWNDLSQALDRDTRPGGVLFLPVDSSYETWFTWGYYGADTVGMSATMHRSFQPAPPFGYFITPARTSIYKRVAGMATFGSPLAARALQDLGIRFIVFRGDVLVPGMATAADSLRRTFPGATVRRFGPLTLFDLGDPRPLVTDYSQWIDATVPLEAGTTLELGALVKDSRPRLDVPPPTPGPAGIAAASPFGDRIPAAALSEVGLTPEGELGISGAQRIVLNTPSVPWTGAVFGKREPQQVALALQGLDPDMVPMGATPFSFFPERAVARAPIALREIPVLVANNAQLGQSPYIAFNPGGAIRGDVVARCLGCTASSPARLSIGGVWLPASVAAESTDATTFRFHGASFPPGASPLAFALPAGATIQRDDLAISLAAAKPERARFLDAFYEVDLPLYEHPLISNPVISPILGVPPVVPYGVASPPVAAFIVFLRTGNTTIPCGIAVDTIHPYDLYTESLDCLRRHDLPTDSATVAAARIVGVGLTNFHSKSRLLQPTGLAISVNTWDYAVVPALWESPVVSATGQRVTQTGQLEAPIVIGDLIDTSMPRLDPGANPAELSVSARRTVRRWSVRPAMPGGVLSVTAPFSSRATTLGVSVQATTVDPLLYSSVYVWKRLAHVARVQFAERIFEMPVPRVAAVAHIGLPPVDAVIKSDGVPGATVGAIGPLVTPPAPTHSCDGDAGQAVIRCRVAANSVLVLNIGYHWSWIALEGFAVLTHVRADGWRNAWIVPASGSVTMINLLDFGVPALALATLATFALLLLRSFKRGGMAA